MTRSVKIASAGVFLGAIIALVPRPCVADIVSYVDEQGRVHYVDSIDRVPEKYRRQAEARPTPQAINKFDFQLDRYVPKKAKTPSPRAEKLQRAAPHEQPAATTSRPRVEIFVTSWCPYCRALEGFLASRGIAYTKYDIEKSPQARAAHARLGGGGIPVTRIGSEVIRGFDKARLLEVLNTAS